MLELLEVVVSLANVVGVVATSSFLTVGVCLTAAFAGVGLRVGLLDEEEVVLVVALVEVVFLDETGTGWGEVGAL